LVHIAAFGLLLRACDHHLANRRVSMATRRRGVASTDLGALLHVRGLRSSTLSLSLRSSNSFEMVGTSRSSDGGEHCDAAAAGKEKEKRDETGHCAVRQGLGDTPLREGFFVKFQGYFGKTNGYAIKFLPSLR
jgi:hypothetical protein